MTQKKNQSILVHDAYFHGKVWYHAIKVAILTWRYDDNNLLSDHLLHQSVPIIQHGIGGVTLLAIP